MTAEANVGVVGLAAMGASLARNLARHGNKVAVFNRHYPRTEKLITEHGSEGEFFPAKTMEEFVASLKKPRTAIIMVKAGEPTGAMIDQLAGLMEPGDIIVYAGTAVDELRDVPGKMATRKPVGVCVDGVQVDSTTAPYRCCAAWAEVPRRSPMRCQEMLLALADVTASMT